MVIILRLEFNIVLYFVFFYLLFFIFLWFVGLGLCLWYWVWDICGVWQILYVKKVIVNCGVGEVLQNVKVLEGIICDIVLVMGQKFVVICFRKVIVGFKFWEGVFVGVIFILCGEVCI